MKNKIRENIGWIASGIAIVMFMSYIDQIRLNLNGQKGSVLMPVATIVNCVFWIIYGASRTEKEWPIIVCNIVGLVVCSVAIFTAII